MNVFSVIFRQDLQTENVLKQEQGNALAIVVMKPGNDDPVSFSGGIVLRILVHVTSCVVRQESIPGDVKLLWQSGEILK